MRRAPNGPARSDLIWDAAEGAWEGITRMSGEFIDRSLPAAEDLILPKSCARIYPDARLLQSGKARLVVLRAARQ